MRLSVVRGVVCFVTFVVCLGVGFAQGNNVEHIGHIGGQITAVAIQGNYAYIGEGWSLRILDISNPSAPKPKGNIVIPNGVNAVAVSGKLAYVADSSGGFRIIDVSIPEAPFKRGFHETPDFAHDLAIFGNLVYVADGVAGLRIINVSNPGAPYESGFFDTPGVANGVAVSGNLVYVADGEAGLRIIDVSNPDAPYEHGFYDTPSVAYDIALSGDLAYVADESGGLRIIDVSNPEAPYEHGFYVTNGATKVEVSGDLTYVESGFKVEIIDTSNPEVLFVRGYIPVSHFLYGLTVIEDLVYAAGYNTGLEIINVLNPDAPYGLACYGTSVPCGVTVSGELAYLGGWDSNGGGLRIIDVSNPEAPFKRGWWYGACSVVVAGDLAYLTNWDGGLRIIDVSNPEIPSERGSFDTPGSAHGVAVLGNLAYVADWDGGLRIINVSNPNAPYELGSYDTLGFAYAVAVSGNLAYVADGEAGLRIIDVSNPDTPYQRGFFYMPGDAYAVAVSGDLAYVANGDRWSGSLRIIDVSNPEAPYERGFFYTSYTNDVEVSGNLVYVADGDRGLRIIDVSNPEAPYECGFFDTPGDAAAVAVSEDLIFVAGWDAGLFILRYTGDTSGFLRVTAEIEDTSSADKATTRPAIGAQIQSLGQTHFQTTDQPVLLGPFPAGDTQLTVSAGEYIPKTIDVSVVGGLTRDLRVTLSGLISQIDPDETPILVLVRGWTAFPSKEETLSYWARFRKTWRDREHFAVWDATEENESYKIDPTEIPEKSAPRLKTWLRNRYEQNMDGVKEKGMVLIGHSMGGTIIRALLMDPESSSLPIRGFATIGTPYTGTPVADKGAFLGILGDNLIQNCDLLLEVLGVAFSVPFAAQVACDLAPLIEPVFEFTKMPSTYSLQTASMSIFNQNWLRSPASKKHPPALVMAGHDEWALHGYTIVNLLNSRSPSDLIVPVTSQQAFEKQPGVPRYNYAPGSYAGSTPSVILPNPDYYKDLLETSKTIRPPLFENVHHGIEIMVPQFDHELDAWLASLKTGSSPKDVRDNNPLPPQPVDEPTSMQVVRSDSLQLAGVGIHSSTFSVDPAKRLSVFVSSVSGEVTLTLVTPDSVRIDAAAAQLLDASGGYVSEVYGAATYQILGVSFPIPGEWTLEMQYTPVAGASETIVSVDILLAATPELTVLDTTRPLAEYDQVVACYLGEGANPVTILSAQADVVTPQGLHLPLALFDDGQHLDGAASDGIAAATLSGLLLEEGLHEVSVKALGLLDSGWPVQRLAQGQFVSPKKVGGFTGYFDETPIDKGQDGGYDSLLIDCEIDFPEKGTYHLSGLLLAASDVAVATASVLVNDVPAGRMKFTLIFDGMEIHTAGLNGPYRLADLTLTLLEGIHVPVDYRGIAYTTMSYKADDFATIPTTVESWKGY